MKKTFAIIIIIFPWKLRRFILIKIWKYKIHPTAKIGFSYIYPVYLEMGPKSKIGHFNVAIHLEKLIIGENSSISRSNWITGFSLNSNSQHFKHQIDRKCELIIGNNSAITKNHHLDCTNQILIGNFVTIAGYNSQFLTHSIDIYENRQDSHSIRIGDFTFIGTNVVVLGGSVLPSYSVLGAKALLNKSFNESWALYGGVPARKVTEIQNDAKYFHRTSGYIY